jgi:hypothetical protein
MNPTKILTIVLFLVSIGLGYYLFNSIKYKIDEEENISKSEARVINKLKMIRDAQLAFMGVNGKYTGSWDSLLSFIDTGKIFLTQRKEEIKMLEYGEEVTTVIIDTLGSISVRDSIFSQRAYPNFNLATLPLIPGTEARFEMWESKINKSGVMVDVVEVRDTKPVDPQRRESNESNIKKPLRFGSQTSITTAGNWE